MDKNYTVLQRIAQHLYITNNHEIGLISGKMGYIIFLFHYARYSSEKHYEIRALELLHEILYHLSDNMEKTYGHGLAGIGIAIDYLIENEFIIANEDILADFDQYMYMAINETTTDYSMYNGLVGIG